MDDDPDVDALREARERLAAGEPVEAFRSLLPLLSYPAPALDDRDSFAQAVAVLASVARALAGDALGDRVAAVAAQPDDPQALFDAAYELYEQRQQAVAATLLARANRLAPGQAAIVAELSACLEALLRNGEAALLVDASGLVDRDPLCTYLSGFGWLMAGDLAASRDRLARLAGVTDEPVAAMREALAGMLARADALLAHGVALDERALQAWHAVLNGSLLLHASPHGYDEPMHGRYAFVSDSPRLMREGLDRLAAVLRASGRGVSRVVAAPDRASRILSRAASRRLALPWIAWSPGAEADGLVVVWDLHAVGDGRFLQAASEHARGQLLFTHASAWVEAFPFAPDVTTFLHQTVTHPWTGGALAIDRATQALRQAPPDLREDEDLALEILAADGEADTSATPLDQVLAIAAALATLEGNAALGLYRSTGRRHRQRSGSPVPSARFA